MGKILSTFKKIDLVDIKFLFRFLVCQLPALVLKLFKKDIWLICERYDTAEDNGWILYQWIRKNHPEQDIYFILSKKGKRDKEAVEGPDDHIVVWSSWRHCLLYLAARLLIKTMFPPPRPCRRLCDYYVKYIKRYPVVYLRHGISTSGVEHHHYKVQGARLFICGAKPEYDYISKSAGYPEGYVQYTGFARFDDLLKNQRDERFVLIMPTWRRYIVSPENTQQENEQAFVQSTYFHHFQSLLNNTELMDYIEQAGYKVKFYIHAEFSSYLHLFDKVDPHVEMIRGGVTVHDLLMSCSLLITDYSSVFFDVAYMKKPMVFYQFDFEEFRAKHISEGYFSYRRHGMGPVVETQAELLEAIRAFNVDGQFVNTDFYLQRCDAFFPAHDNHNCERIYRAIKEI